METAEPATGEALDRKIMADTFSKYAIPTYSNPIGLHHRALIYERHISSPSSTSLPSPSRLVGWPLMGPSVFIMPPFIEYSWNGIIMRSSIGRGRVGVG